MPPLYDYKCEDCHKVREVIEHDNEIGARLCHQCNDFTMKRVISPTKTINLKGEGFYKQGVQ